jgi:hypothetical protein
MRIRSRVIATAFLLVAVTRASAQESLIQRLGHDKLQIASLGASAGRIAPTQVVPTNVYGISADYGEIAPSWRVNFASSFWSSRYRDAVVNQFIDTLQQNVNGSATIEPSRISLYDVTIGTDVRYVPTYSGELKPFLGLGVAAHVINAEGKLIQGTFIERSLDNIAAGFYVVTGVSFRLFKHVGVEGMARADLLSGFRSTQARAGATYYFGRVRGSPPPATKAPTP